MSGCVGTQKILRGPGAPPQSLALATRSRRAEAAHLALAATSAAVAPVRAVAAQVPPFAVALRAAAERVDPYVDPPAGRDDYGDDHHDPHYREPPRDALWTSMCTPPSTLKPRGRFKSSTRGPSCERRNFEICNEISTSAGCAIRPR